MTRKNIQEINFSSDKDRRTSVAAIKTRMPVIRCVCGSEILVVPDLKAMNLAIKNHVAEHKRNFNTSEKLTEFLTEQIIIVANKMIPPL